MTTKKRTEAPIKVRINIRPLVERVGIEKPHHLWLAYGGSKSTAGTLWYGNITSIQFQTIEKLLTIFRREDPAMYSSIVHHLNESGLFIVEDGNGSGSRT
jgi:hypothetical protein